MPRKVKAPEATVTPETTSQGVTHFGLETLLLSSIRAIEGLYGERKPVPFSVLEAFVDCHNHLYKALTIAREKLAQLRLPETTSASQPELPLTERSPHDQG